MAALGLAIGVFLLFCLFGQAALSLSKRSDAPAHFLFAPAAGIVVVILPILVANRLGMPIRSVAWPATAFLVIAALFIHWRCRTWPGQEALPFLGLLSVALLWTGQPLLQRGTDWLSFANGDMGNYTLLAQRLIDNGFYDAPPHDAIRSGTDYSQMSWAPQVTEMQRYGHDILLAWISCLTRWNPQEAFMSLMLACYLATVAAAGGLVLTNPERRTAALATCLLVAFSPLTLYGTYAQLLGQLAGLPVLIVCTYCWCQSSTAWALGRWWSEAALAALMLGGLAVLYPETLPFWGCATLLFLIVGCFRGALSLRSQMLFWLAAGMLATVALNRILMEACFFLLFQSQHGMIHLERNRVIFHYFLSPQGFARLWGWQPLVGGTGPGVFLTIKICGGVLLLAIAAFLALRRAKRFRPEAFLLLAMAGVAVHLHVRGEAFGLFKLAMFVQPILLALIADGLFRFVLRPNYRIAMALALAVFSFPTAVTYRSASRGELGYFAQVPIGMSPRTMTQLREEVKRHAPDRIISDVTSYCFGRLQALNLRGTSLALPSQLQFTTSRLKDLNPWQVSFLPAEVRQQAEQLRRLGVVLTQVVKFPTTESSPESAIYFLRHDFGRESGKEFDHVLASSPRLTVLNRRSYPTREVGEFALIPWREVRNRLITIPAKDGNEGTSWNVLPSSKWCSMMPDHFVPRATLTGWGGPICMEVLRPTKSPRFVLHLANTLRPDDSRLIPSFTFHGKDRLDIPSPGSGSARIILPPLEPCVIDGRTYFAATLQPPQGSNLDLTNPAFRVVHCFVREISLLSEEEAAGLTPPSKVERFPEDLTHSSLEYSGMFEDGWMTEKASFKLKSAIESTRLMIRGMCPSPPEPPAMGQELTVRVNGEESARLPIPYGAFEFAVPIPPGTAARQVELHFAHSFRLSAADRRQAAARLDSISLK